MKKVIFLLSIFPLVACATPKMYNPYLNGYYPVATNLSICKNSKIYQSRDKSSLGFPSIQQAYKPGFVKVRDTVRLYNNVIAWSKPVISSKSNSYFYVSFR